MHDASIFRLCRYGAGRSDLKIWSLLLRFLLVWEGSGSFILQYAAFNSTLLYMTIGHLLYFDDFDSAFLYNFIQSLRKDLATFPQVTWRNVQRRDKADDLIHRSRKKQQALFNATFRDSAG